MGVFFCFVRLLVFNLGEVMRKGVRESYGFGDLLVLGFFRGGIGVYGGSK